MFQVPKQPVATATFLADQTIVVASCGKIFMIDENLEDWTFNAPPKSNFVKTAICEFIAPVITPFSRMAAVYSRGIFFYNSYRMLGNIDDRPAVILASGGRRWYKNGVLHRNDGPAIIWADGTEEWVVDGRTIESL
mgnify:CR=1 FL=1